MLKHSLKQFSSVAVTGPRQSGKSTMLRHTLPEARYQTLDDPLVRSQAQKDPNLFLDQAGELLIIDEIQHAPELPLYIKLRIDRDREKRGRFIVTGSQQFALIKNLGDSLAGRIGILELSPFNLVEIERSGADVRPMSVFLNACLRGSFPELVTNPEIDSPRWYAAYVQTYLERDIRSVYDIGSLREFEMILQLLATRTAQELHLSSLAADAGVAVNTVKKWISILEACRIIYLLPPYHSNMGKRIVKAPKVYFMDCGLVCYLTRLRDPDHLMNGPMAGALFENFCVQEAVKAMLSRGIPPRLFYLRTKAGLEIDLIVEGNDGCLHPFEFKLSRTPRSDMSDAIGRFRREFSALKIEQGAVVSLSDEKSVLSQCAVALPVIDFVGAVKTLAQI